MTGFPARALMGLPEVFGESLRSFIPQAWSWATFAKVAYLISVPFGLMKYVIEKTMNNEEYRKRTCVIVLRAGRIQAPRH